MIPMKTSPERHPKVLLPLVRKQVFKEVLKEVGRALRPPKEELVAPKTADLSDTCEFITGDSTLNSTWVTICSYYQVRD